MPHSLLIVHYVSLYGARFVIILFFIVLEGVLPPEFN